MHGALCGVVAAESSPSKSSAAQVAGTTSSGVASAVPHTTSSTDRVFQSTVAASSTAVQVLPGCLEIAVGGGGVGSVSVVPVPLMCVYDPLGVGSSPVVQQSPWLPASSAGKQVGSSTKRTKRNWTKGAHRSRAYACICVCVVTLVQPLCGYWLSPGPTEDVSSRLSRNW